MAFYNIKEDLLRLPTYINFPKEEENILRYWLENKIFEKCQRKSLGKPVYSFYDGPPFATGLPHYGHILAGTIKDVMTRYAYQNGYHVERRFGWDCHGLPVEHEVDKEFGIKSSEDVMKLSLATYNKRCREVVMRYAKEWQEVTERMGRWIDFENDYKTMYPTFMETVWWVFKQLYEKGLVYRGVKVMPYSTACTTPISNFEAGQNYKDVTENSIMVKFKAVDLEANFLVWTTTPWTLPANLALCVNPNLTYVKVKEEDTGELYILAKNRLEYVFKKKKFSIHDTFSGEHLKDTRYVPLFLYYQEYGRRMNAFRVLVDDYVVSDSGSGIVHQAPFFGEDDYRICLSAGIIKKDGEIICPVNDAGLFTKDVPDFAGQYIKDADKQIVSLLKSRGDIFRTLQISHRYPYCWRSDTPLIYKAVPSWFIRVNHMSHELLEACSKTHWVPEYVKEKRFANWLQNSRDWAVSRNRYWGTPIPIWMSDDGSEIVCIGSLKELEKKSGKKITDLHREFIDDIEMASAIPGNKPLKRVKEVFDCWFESGSMPYAQLHYPFKNTENFTQSFPADFIAEGIDQTRGWFYTLLVISNVLFGKAPYKNVIVNGLVLAADGQKMSKSKKNFPDPMEVVNKYGADALRLYLINSPVVKGENLRFTEEGVHGVTKDVFLPWYNSFRFFVQNVERLDKGDSFKFLYNTENHHSAVNSTSLLDQWILSAKENLIKFVADELQQYRLYTILPRLLKFLDDLTNWYVRLSKLSLKGELGMQNCLNSMNTLYDILLSITKLMAPFVPFLAEYFYQRLAIFNEDTPKESVHFLRIPTANLQFIKHDVEASISRMQNVILLGRMIRERHNLPLKYPVRNVTVIQSNPTFMQDINPLKDFIIRELNTKSISFSTDKRKFGIVTSAQADYKSLGLRLKKDLNPVAQAIRSLNEDDIETYMKSESFTICGHEISPSEIRLFYNISSEFDSSKEYGIQGDTDILVLIDLTIEKEFEEEGLAREIINRIQKLKKRIQLIPTDQVLVYYTDYSQNQVLTSVCQKYKSFIKNIIKSPFDVLSASNNQNIITSDTFQLKEGNLKITICSLEVANLPAIDWCNVTLHPEIQERYTTGRKASLLLQKLNGSYLSLDELKSEIINIFGLYGLDLVLYCDGRKFRDAKFAARKIITVCKPQHKIRTMDVITRPFSRFVNCQLGETKYTVFLENPSGSGNARNLSEILDLVFPNVLRENIVLSE